MNLCENVNPSLCVQAKLGSKEGEKFETILNEGLEVYHPHCDHPL